MSGVLVNLLFCQVESDVLEAWGRGGSRGWGEKGVAAIGGLRLGRGCWGMSAEGVGWAVDGPWALDDDRDAVTVGDDVVLVAQLVGDVHLELGGLRAEWGGGGGLLGSHGVVLIPDQR